MGNASQKKFAVITGASSGIGYELAAIFAKNGFDIMIAAEDSGIENAAENFKGFGVDVQSIQTDLSTYNGVEILVQAIQATNRPVDALAVNAGIGAWGEFAKTSDLKKELELIDLNITSAVHLTKRLLADMVARDKGRILFTSSIAGTAPGPFEAVYAASKAFIQSFAEAIRDELKETGVTVTSLMPGATETNFFVRAGMEHTKVGMSEKDDPTEVAQQGFDALMRGDDHVVAGSFKNKVLAGANRILSDKMRAAQARKNVEPLSAADVDKYKKNDNKSANASEHRH